MERLCLKLVVAVHALVRIVPVGEVPGDCLAVVAGDVGTVAGHRCAWMPHGCGIKGNLGGVVGKCRHVLVGRTLPYTRVELEALRSDLSLADDLDRQELNLTGAVTWVLRLLIAAAPLRRAPTGLPA